MIYQNKRGFTLLEMVIVMMLMAVAGGMVSLITHAGFKSFSTAKETTQLNQQAQLALARINREVRLAKQMTTLNAQQFAFVATDGTSINYQLKGSTLERQQNAQTPEPLAEHVSGLTFTYLDSSFNATVSAVYYIQIDLTLSDNGQTLSWQTVIHPRNT